MDLQPIPSKLKYVTIPLRISSVLYLIIGLLYGGALLFAPSTFWDMPKEESIIIAVTGGVTIVLCIAFAIFMEVTIRFLKKGAFWAWVAGICIAGLYLPSLFLLLGVFMLIGALNDEVKEFCAKK
jgi:hypothetical protein